MRYIGVYWGNIGVILGIYRDNGKENGNYYSIIGYILGLYRDNGKENGNYYIGFRGLNIRIPFIIPINGFRVSIFFSIMPIYPQYNPYITPI